MSGLGHSLALWFLKILSNRRPLVPFYSLVNFGGDFVLNFSPIPHNASYFTGGSAFHWRCFAFGVCLHSVCQVSLRWCWGGDFRRVFLAAGCWFYSFRDFRFLQPQNVVTPVFPTTISCSSAVWWNVKPQHLVCLKSSVTISWWFITILFLGILGKRYHDSRFSFPSFLFPNNLSLSILSFPIYRSFFLKNLKNVRQ